MTSSIYPQPATTIGTPIAAATDIFLEDIPITSEMVSPGGGGILRLMFGFAFAATPAILTVTNDGIIKGILNADNAGAIITDGYYRFDIEVEAGDLINLQSNTQVDTINFIRAHLVQFGA